MPQEGRRKALAAKDLAQVQEIARKLQKNRGKAVRIPPELIRKIEGAGQSRVLSELMSMRDEERAASVDALAYRVR